MKVVIPYVDQPVSFWKDLRVQFGANIREVYFPVMHHCVGSGRPLQPSENLYEFLSSRVFSTSVLINPVVLPHPVENLSDGILFTINHLSQEYNVNSVTLTNIQLAHLIRREFPHMTLTASVLMDIFTPAQASLLNGIFDNLVPASRILRNLKALQEVRDAFNGKIRLLVNESCLPNCLSRTQHFYEMSNRDIHYPQSLCNETIAGNPWISLTGSWILPQHLQVYDGIYDEIKFSGRVTLSDPERYFTVLDSYINSRPLTPDCIGGGPASVPYPIDITERFFRKTMECEKNCHECNYCREYYETKLNRLNNEQVYPHR